MWATHEGNRVGLPLDSKPIPLRVFNPHDTRTERLPSENKDAKNLHGGDKNGRWTAPARWLQQDWWEKLEEDALGAVILEHPDNRNQDCSKRNTLERWSTRESKSLCSKKITEAAKVVMPEEVRQEFKDIMPWPAKRYVGEIDILIGCGIFPFSHGPDVAVLIRYHGKSV